MDSDSKSTKSEEDSSTKYVLDYYRKFSQNKDLPKYFSGTSISYLPEIRDDVENEPQEIIIKTDVDIVITADERKQNEPGDSSPTSSIKSNRKLEWDNGADIGYHNCLITKKIHKSCSLPLLSDLKTRQVAFEFAQPSTSSRTPKSESSGGSNVKLVVFPCSSSSEGNSVEMKHYSSSSSVSDSKKGNFITSTSSKNESSEKVDTPSSSSSTSQKILSFKSTLSHLKKKIGLPDAQSTPNSLEEITIGSGNILATPVIKNREKPAKVLVLDEKCDSEIEDAKVKVEEAPDNAPPKEYVNEPSKTGENDCEQNLGINNKSKPTKKVVNLCLTNPLSIECLSIPPEPKKQFVQTSAEYLTVAVQTDHISEKELIKIIASQQNLNQSLLFLGHQKMEQMMEVHKQHLNLKPPPTGSEKGEGPSTKSSGSRESSSGNVHLAEAVSTQNIGNDIEKSVYILQKLLRSKKYDAATKKRYVKRILKKITDSKTEVSKVSLKIAKVQSTDSSGERSQQPGMEQSRFSREGKLQSSPRKKVYSQEFAKDELSSPPEIIPVKSRDTRKNLFTLTNNEFSVGRYQDQALKALESRKPKTLGTNDDTSLEKQFDSSSTSRSYHNWKEDKTVSEKKYILNGHGDCMEREYQINWIDREINHLAKLKSLLKKPTESTPAEKTKSTTSTYAVSRKSDQPAKTDNGSKRKFVIETKLGAGSSKQRNFKLDGKKYSVENLTEVETGVEEPGQVQADIEVISTDTTTNIIVTTLCEVCKSRHCVCADESSGSFKRESAKDNVCHKCGKYSCSCGSLSNVKSTETSNFSSTGAISNKCISLRDAICARCRKCPCLCVKPQKDSAGTSEGEKISEPSSETSSGSLSRVFQNCNCNAKSKCNCGFVEKLLHHFNKEDLFRDLNFEDISVQTEPERHIDTNSIGVQMQVDTRNQNLQTSKREATKASQTIIEHQQRQVQTTAEEIFDYPK
ncbi:hypothetical protein JTB14_021398 [Gonioctena quinquepunctata]|nr:hypothetical protein JTB14_021398 [Gonioctena quinquepunctata]